MWEYTYTNELYHHGIKGQKWGVRRYQNADGTLTSAGKKRYDYDTSDSSDSIKKKDKTRVKTAVKVGATAAGTALAVYGAYKLSNYIKSEAGKKSYEAGKKYAEEAFFKKANALLDSWDPKEPLDMTRSNQIHSFITAGKQTLANTDKRTKKVQQSTIEAIKYLKHPENYQIDADLMRWH